MKGEVTELERPGSRQASPVGPGRPEPGAAARKRAAVELIRSHGSALKATARRYSICTDDADDAYQRGLEILLQKAPSTELRQLVPWARTVIKHEALALRRGREKTLGRPAGASLLEEEQDWVALIPAAGEGPEDRLLGREKVARSREALARLKPQELKALTQLAEGYSYAEIGAMNAWTRTKVNRCLAEGRERFRSAFRESEAGERCAALEPLLSACADGELDRARRGEVEDHLAVCGPCRATLRTYRAAPQAAAALAPLLPVSRGLWERIQELAVSAHGKLQALGDPAGTGAASAGAGRGALPTVAVKLAALCAGTAGTAAVCVATGVLPAPVLHSRPESRPERPAREQVVREAPPAIPATRPPAPAGGERGQADSEPKPAGQAGRRSARQRAKAPTPPPAPTPTEAEFSPESAGAPVSAAPPPAPPPAASASAAPAGGGVSGGGGVPVGGGGGEFGP